MNEPRGQILPGSAFGDALTRLAQAAETIVEIGTWHGLGSTLCLARGLVRPTQRFWTIEADPNVFEGARKCYKDNRIIWICGTVTPMNDRPIIIEQLPERIDLLLIDGGDGNGLPDFMALHQRSTIIALDDTNDQCVKGQESRRLLIEWKWKCLIDDQQNRNGWSIFQRA